MDTEFPGDYSGREEQPVQRNGGSTNMTCVMLIEEVTPQQGGPCRKQEEIHLVKGVRLGELSAANLKCQAVYPLCSVYFMVFFSSPQFWYVSGDVILLVFALNDKNLGRNNLHHTNY